MGRDITADLLARQEYGIAKHGKPLRPNNGRSAQTDGYQEILDFCNYRVQKLMEDANAGHE
jgi:hypothetical protein